MAKRKPNPRPEHAYDSGCSDDVHSPQYVKIKCPACKLDRAERTVIRAARLLVRYGDFDGVDRYTRLVMAVDQLRKVEESIRNAKA